jgi:hypothetical protein
MEKLLVLTLIAAALIDMSLAVDRIVVNADNRINKIYIDGVDKTGALVNRKDWKRCDKIDIPDNSGVIAIEAWNKKSFYGINACWTARNVIYDPWRCRRVLPAQGDNWYKPSYRARWWKLAKGFRCKWHCHNKYFQQPCKLYNQKCYWTNKYARRVRCRVKICADNCWGCKNAGAGKCDPDKCKYGAGTNSVTGEKACRRECGVEIQLYSGLPNDGPCGYFKVWDTTTKTPQILPLMDGLYGVAVDMSTCSIYKEPLYWPMPATEEEDEGAGPTYKTIVEWNDITQPSGIWRPEGEFTNKVGFAFMVGRGPTGPNNFYTLAPLLYRYTSLGIGDAILGDNYVWYNPCIYRATFRAAPNDKAILVSEDVVGNIPGGPSIIRSSDPCCQ